eukprot:CAMPEP_0202689102 /NCGR_PEP_ID=MMETSP1385-20130828/4445_1 /ASSEMBLY_ACC=CAM_ASM_000861 /TAXON_ID=933848 /ORGANISM="Elphidium margaritaceum" /LENGTH=220 /DNA_ID=CAMNT_0049344193 /DNA_START=69 /DNA_END=731 /DNA_ORIENTATION=-
MKLSFSNCKQSLSRYFHANRCAQIDCVVTASLAHHQKRFETENIYKRPRYAHYEDGSKWIIGSTVRVLPNGMRVDTSIDTFQKFSTGRNTFTQANAALERAETYDQDREDQTSESYVNEAEQLQQEQEEQAAQTTQDELMDDMDENEKTVICVETPIDSVHGVGPKTATILRSKGIETAEQLLDAIQNSEEIVEELESEVRGFQRIVENAKEVLKNAEYK